MKSDESMTLCYVNSAPIRENGATRAAERGSTSTPDGHEEHAGKARALKPEQFSPSNSIRPATPSGEGGPDCKAESETDPGDNETYASKNGKQIYDYSKTPMHHRVAFADHVEEMSVVESTRMLGLYQDYHSQDPLASLCIPLLPEKLVDDVADTFMDTALKFSNATNGVEKWEVEKASASFLASLFASSKGEGIPSVPDDSVRTFGDLRLVEPVLDRDPELELLQLKRRNMAVISARGVDLFNPDTSDNQSIAWHPHVRDFPEKKNHDIASDKLEASRDSIEYLREIMHPSYSSDQGMVSTFLELDKRKRNQVHSEKSLSPIVMPLSPPSSVPAFPGLLHGTGPPCTPADPLDIDATNVDDYGTERDEVAAAAEGLTGAKNVVQATAVNPIELHMGLETPANSSPSPLRGKRLQDLRRVVQAQSQETCGMSANKAEIFEPAVRLPDSDMSLPDPTPTKQDSEAVGDNTSVPEPKLATHRNGKGQLKGFDTTIHVPVPQLPDIEPILPWAVHRPSDGTVSGILSQQSPIATLKRGLLRNEQRWSGISRLERMLPWTPFPARLGKVRLHEDFDYNESSDKYIDDLAYDCEIDVESLVAKTKPLRCLDVDDDGGNLEPIEMEDEMDGQEPQNPLYSSKQQSSPPAHYAHERTQSAITKAVEAPPPPAAGDGRDMRTLLHRRKLELQRADRDAVEGHIGKRVRLTVEDSEPSRLRGLFGEDSIAGFMQLQRGHSQIPSHSLGLPSRTVESATGAADAGGVVEAAESTAAGREAFAVPRLIHPERNIQVVVSTHVLANRSLVRQLQRMLPNLDMVERGAIPGEARSSDTSRSGRAHDGPAADMTVSPTTGLLTTTVQQLKQKALPGQTSYFGIRERVATASLSHERLIVLVSDGHHRAGPGGGSIAQPFDGRDYDALADFLGFAARLDGDVRATYVPGGDDELAQWIAMTILRHAVSSPDTVLMHDETLWERVLRAAGLNAFAAQAILGQLTGPEKQRPAPTMSPSSASYGLAAFIHMSPEERQQQLGPTLGGGRVLARVRGAIDGSWPHREVLCAPPAPR